MDETYFKVKSKLGKEISITEIYWQFIVSEKHRNIKGKEKLVQESLLEPILIKASKKDPKVVLYYRSFENKYLCTVVRHENGTGFIITVYITDKIKEGKILWEK